MEDDRWFDQPANKRELGRFLVLVHRFTGDQMRQYYERPWAFDAYWLELQERELQVAREHGADPF